MKNQPQSHLHYQSHHIAGRLVQTQETLLNTKASKMRTIPLSSSPIPQMGLRYYIHRHLTSLKQRKAQKSYTTTMATMSLNKWCHQPTISGHPPPMLLLYIRSQQDTQ